MKIINNFFSSYKISKIFLILVSAFSVNIASAFEVSLYGQGHVSADRVDDGQDASWGVASNSSRLGFNGEHTLTSGITVIFQYESGVDLTTQGVNDGNGPADSEGQLFTKGRPSFIGLKGQYGEVAIGHMNALDQWANDYNLFADYVGDIGNILEGSGIPGRLDNVIYYKSPDYHNGHVAFSYVPEEGDEEEDNLIIKGNYQKGPLKVGLAYASIGQALNREDHKVQAITVGYYHDNWTIGGGFQNETDIQGISGVDRVSFTFGGSIALGERGTLKAQWVTSNGEGEQMDVNMYALGYDYSLGEHTLIYVAYAHTDNDANVAFSVNGKGHGDRVQPMAGEDPNAISFGIIHKFRTLLFKR